MTENMRRVPHDTDMRKHSCWFLFYVCSLAAPMSTPQMHVTATTAAGQPLMASGPLPQFIPYPAAPPPHFQSQYGPVPMRMYHDQPQQLQFLTQTPPSTTPSPGQPGQQQFHPPPQPSPAGGGPQTTAFTAQTQPPGTYHLMCVPTQLVPSPYFPGGAPQHAPQNQQFQIVMQQPTTQ